MPSSVARAVLGRGKAAGQHHMRKIYPQKIKHKGVLFYSCSSVCEWLYSVTPGLAGVVPLRICSTKRTPLAYL
jgi:hypothetical protein